MRIEPLNDFTVQFHDEAQHAVRRRMLGAEVDRVVLNVFAAGGRREIWLE
jgi:hypothetical protein